MSLMTHIKPVTQAMPGTKDSVQVHPGQIKKAYDTPWSPESVPPDYREYLVASLSAIKQQSIANGYPEVKVTVIELIEELPFWLDEFFIWPFILHNQKGQPVFMWRMDGNTIELERFLLNTNVLYRAKAYSTRLILGNDIKPEIISPENFANHIKQFMEATHKFFVAKNVDWKKHFVW